MDLHSKKSQTNTQNVNIPFSNKFSTWEATINPKGETFSKSNKCSHLLSHQLQHQNEHKQIKMHTKFKTKTPLLNLNFKKAIFRVVSIVDVPIGPLPRPQTPPGLCHIIVCVIGSAYKFFG